MTPWNAAPASTPLPDLVTRLTRERGVYAEALMEMNVRYEQKIRELSLLRRTTDGLRDCTDLDEVFRRLVAVVLEELGTLACSLYLADENAELVLKARGMADGPVEIFRRGHPGGLRIPPDQSPLGQTFTTGEIRMEPAVPEGTLGWFPVDAPVLLTAPLGPPTACTGVLALHERRIEDVPEDVSRLLPILASQATIAIENAALYQRLKQHSDTLEARVRERTAALEQLNAELQAVARQKSQFFAHFSHELRTPLNSILGFSEMLLAKMHGPLTDTQQRHVRRVHESGHQLLRLINDILDLAKVEAGKLSLHVQPMALVSAVEQALATMHPQATARHHRLEQAVPPDLPAVLADPTRVNQILLNLLSNAIKFTPEGGSVTVTARLAGDCRLPPPADPTGRAGIADCRLDDREDPNRKSPIANRQSGEWVEIAVQDTGVGVALEDQGRLFQDFEQVLGAGGRQQGTGLGLSLTRRLVSLHGGQVGLISAPGQGSTFWFTLPTAPALQRERLQEAQDAIRRG
jgi:signal transduction histidine kinase